MKSPRGQIRHMLWTTSHLKSVLITVTIIVCAALAVGARFYALTPVVLNDNSLYPKVPKGKRVWICTLPQCRQNIKTDDIVLAKRPGSGEVFLRRVIGLPGTNMQISLTGEVTSPGLNFHWDGENAFIDTRSFHIPKAGDTLAIGSLNDVEFDYAARLVAQNFGRRNVRTQVTLLQGSQPMPLERIGTARLASRPVSVREVSGLPWQELYLIQLQIQREEPGSRHIHFMRRIYKVKDSSEVAVFRVKEDNYYLACFKGNQCQDSRELGYFTKKSIVGKMIPVPDFTGYAERWYKKVLRSFKKAEKKQSKAKQVQPE